ncbi:hypothetical protein NXS98_02645 [Fontisphaera persica]|uniref:hypothetical protein n=1 Tax=Fontisphaera persica TaxID=2974023 RepID=UPI0024BFE337|nr:hypothetical protein [Fontisphaera persica]WCJ60042.1 hypothetical protein NXS98_02645 [Fontisphaera persica]
MVHTAERLVRGVTNAVVTWTNNVLWQVGAGAGRGREGECGVDPQLRRVPGVGRRRLRTGRGRR